MADYADRREEMVRRQIAGRGIREPRLLDAFRAVPRELFVPEEARELAYDDGPLPIESGQTISQPYIVALMIEAAAVGPGARLLEIGAGSGYAAAVASRLAAEVIAIERHPELARLARGRMERLGFGNVRIVEGDGTIGLPGEAPFDSILCSAAGSHVPEALRRQLSIGGALVIPIGEPGSVQKLVKVSRRDEEDFRTEDLGAVRFVPLIGAQGWADPDGETSR
ncbi:MAG TPA: protein-L-isoaspartate(D-aspartate) O-methyltransferase, partial [Allosphingosinicella sp.]|nr:protein-L-isoaspartate(D-aspartate) O-methyltransferase [Allosphingosinicella sp.]